MMDQLKEYFERNKQMVIEVFNSLAKDKMLPATSAFPFFQQIFFAKVQFVAQGKNFLQDDENQSVMEKTIEQYYRKKQGENGPKFYLYRVSFVYDEIFDLLEFWLSNNPEILIKFTEHEFSKTSKSNFQLKYEQPNQFIENGSDLRESTILDNEFLVQEQKIPMLILAYEGEIKKYQIILSQNQGKQETNESVQYQLKIKQLKEKTDLLRKKLEEIHKLSKLQRQNSKVPDNQSDRQKESPAKSSSKASVFKQPNFKLIFEFYAKQIHLTGGKATFDRIQHQSQAINYQKLVHFLREYDIFPGKPKDQKKLHNLYVRNCANTRDLAYEDFIKLLEKLPDVVIQGDDSPEAKREIMFTKINSKNNKNKLLNNPFHSLEKPTFRIDSSEINYSFKLKPIKGIFVDQINQELDLRRQSKQKAKSAFTKQKQAKYLKYLKKLMKTDPYHEDVLKNMHLLVDRPVVETEPVASLSNMQKYRDASFDMKLKFGLDGDIETDIMKQIMPPSPRKDRYGSMDRQVKEIEKKENQRMNQLMNGIIQRGQLRIDRIGVKHAK